MADKYNRIGKFSCGWAAVEMKDGSGVTFVSKLGDLMPFRFTGVNDFHDGMAVVELKDDKGNIRSTYLSQDEILCPILFEEVSYFEGEFGYGYIGKEEYIVDRKFNVYQFKNTLLDKIEPAKDPNNPDMALVNVKTGQVKKFDLIFKPCGKISEGMLPIYMKDDSGFTFLDEHYNIMPQRFAHIATFKNGRANVMLTDGSLGYVNKEGDFFLVGERSQKKKPEQAIIEMMENALEELEKMGIKNKEFESPFFKRVTCAQEFANKVLADYIKIKNENDKQEFIRKYQPSQRDLEILEQTIATALGEYYNKMKDDLDDEENDL